MFTNFVKFIELWCRKIRIRSKKLFLFYFFAGLERWQAVVRLRPFTQSHLDHPWGSENQKPKFKCFQRQISRKHSPFYFKTYFVTEIFVIQNLFRFFRTMEEWVGLLDADPAVDPTLVGGPASLEECWFRTFFAIRNYILAKNLSARTNKMTWNCKISVVSVRPCVQKCCRQVFTDPISKICCKRQNTIFHRGRISNRFNFCRFCWNRHFRIVNPTGFHDFDS